MNNASHIHNRVIIWPGTKVTHYEPWTGRNPNIKYFHVFHNTCYILEDREKRQNLDPKSDEGVFLGYSINNMAYSMFKKHVKYMMKSINLIVNDDETKMIPQKDENFVLPGQNFA